MRGFWLLVAGMVVLVGSAMAQDSSARAAREASLDASRYELSLGKLERANEQMLSEVRALQRENQELKKAAAAASARAQAVADELQRFQNTDLMNVQSSNRQLSERFSELENKGPVWGDAQRDCAEIGVKHQQLKVAVKPDGSRGVRYLCFDGKVLHLGSEVYGIEE